MRHRTQLFLLAAVVALVVAAPPALACSCMEPSPPVESAEQADAVFTGRAVSVERIVKETDYGKIGQRKVVFALDAVWKGVEEGDEVVVYTGTGGGDCGIPFDEGESYMVYAYGEPDDLSTGICSRTRPVELAGPDMVDLGDPTREVEPAEMDEGGCS